VDLFGNIPSNNFLPRDFVHRYDKYGQYFNLKFVLLYSVLILLYFISLLCLCVSLCFIVFRYCAACVTYVALFCVMLWGNCSCRRSFSLLVPAVIYCYHVFIFVFYG